MGRRQKTVDNILDRIPCTTCENLETRACNIRCERLHHYGIRTETGILLNINARYESYELLQKERQEKENPDHPGPGDKEEILDDWEDQRPIRTELLQENIRRPDQGEYQEPLTTENNNPEEFSPSSSYLGKYQSKRIDIGELVELMEGMKLFRECKVTQKNHFISFWECMSMAEIAELAGDGTRQNQQIKFKRLTKKLVRRILEKKNIPIAKEQLDKLTPTQAKISLGL